MLLELESEWGGRYDCHPKGKGGDGEQMGMSAFNWRAFKFQQTGSTLKSMVAKLFLSNKQNLRRNLIHTED